MVTKFIEKAFLGHLIYCLLWNWLIITELTVLKRNPIRKYKCLSNTCGNCLATFEMTHDEFVIHMTTFKMANAIYQL